MLSTDLRPRFDFLVTPAFWWRPRTAGRWLSDSEGSSTSFRDLSVLMEGDVARRAARECRDGARRGDWSVKGRYYAFARWLSLTLGLFGRLLCHFCLIWWFGEKCQKSFWRIDLASWLRLSIEILSGVMIPVDGNSSLNTTVCSTEYRGSCLLSSSPSLH